MQRTEIAKEVASNPFLEIGLRRSEIRSYLRRNGMKKFGSAFYTTLKRFPCFERSREMIETMLGRENKRYFRLCKHGEALFFLKKVSYARIILELFDVVEEVEEKLKGRMILLNTVRLLYEQGEMSKGKLLIKTYATRSRLSNTLEKLKRIGLVYEEEDVVGLSSLANLREMEDSYKSLKEKAWYEPLVKARDRSFYFR